MPRKTLLVLPIVLAILLSACGGSGNQSDQVSLPVIEQKLELAQPDRNLPAPDELELLMATPLSKGSSDIEGMADGWTPNVFGSGNFSQDGSALVIDTDSGTQVGALYRLVFANGAIYEKQVPFIYPYEIQLNTDNAGDIYVLLPNYVTNRWEVVDGTTKQGSTISIPGGLTGNHGNSTGSIVFGIVAWNGSDVRIESIDLLLPDIPAPGNPIDYHQYIEAEDGTLLATNIYMPYAETNPFIPDPPYPSVLIRTPYNKALVDIAVLVKPLTDVNVTVMVQYFRGRLSDSGDWPDSGGTESVFRDHAGPDHMDAIDTVDWLEQRHWYNGKLVASGPSALGLWIYQAAPELGERLTGFYPMLSSGNVANWAITENGVLKEGNVQVFLTANNYPPALLDEVLANFDDPDYVDSYDYDSRASEVRTPAFHETGWYDVNVDATINSWKALHDNGGEGAAGNQWLVIGPWDHQTIRMQTVGELIFPSGDRHDPTELPTMDPSYTWDGYEWGPNLFVPGGFSLIDPPANKVLAYFIGEEGSTSEPHNTWYEFSDWPPAYTEQELFLTSINTLDSIAEVSDEEIGYSLDPNNPVATIGGALLPGIIGVEPFLAGPFDQASLLPDTRIIEFSGPPLGAATSIAGPIIANMYVSSDAVDTDVCVKLIDKYPDGTLMLVSDGVMRLSHADPAHSGGETVEMSFNLGSRAYAFGAGHQIVVHVQGSNYPKYNPNPGNGSSYHDFNNPGAAVVQNNLLKLGGSQASSILLPIYDPE